MTDHFRRSSTMDNEDYQYGYEDGYADAKLGHVEVPNREHDEYRRGYQEGVAAWNEGKHV